MGDLTYANRASSRYVYTLVVRGHMYTHTHRLQDAAAVPTADYIELGGHIYTSTVVV